MLQRFWSPFKDPEKNTRVPVVLQRKSCNNRRSDAASSPSLAEGERLGYALGNAEMRPGIPLFTDTVKNPDTFAYTPVKEIRVPSGCQSML